MKKQTLKRIKKYAKTAVLAAACAAALALVALPAVFMNSISGYLPILLLLFAMLLSLVGLYLIRRVLKVETDSKEVICQRGGSLNIALRLLNPSFLACPRARAMIYISDLFGQEAELRPVSFSVPARDKVELGFDMDMPHLGCYSLGLERVEISGFFGLLSATVPAKGSYRAIVTPCLRPIRELDISEEALTDAARETRITVVGGTDYTGVRPYALGDPMKQIHWKLSAHSREYVTKLQESNRQQEYVLLLDFAVEAGLDKEQLMDINDSLVETTLSLAEEIAAHEESYTLVYVDRAGQISRSIPALGGNDVELMNSFAMVTLAATPAFPDAAQLLREEGRVQNRANNVIVVTSRATADLAMQLIEVQQQRRKPQLFLVVPAEWNDKQRSQAAQPLALLKDSGVDWHFISTAETVRPPEADKGNALS